jgi:uncharacterized protein
VEGSESAQQDGGVHAGLSGLQPCGGNQPATIAPGFEIIKDQAGKFRFHLKAADGEIIAASQGYEAKKVPIRASSRSKRVLPTRRS